MKALRKILFPISFLYGQFIRFRNKSFDKGIKTSTVFAVPTISVGNLSVGGTGKTPHIEYFIRLFKNTYKVAVLSRGYKRETKGFLLANNTSKTTLIGDEPMQYFLKFKEIYVAVDSDRTNGLNQLMKLKPSPDVVLLDDAFQHRRVKTKVNILLTTYNDLYVDDYMLPTGNLRELPVNAKRATHIIVTKCPLDLTTEAQEEIRLKLKPNPAQKLYFSGIAYKNEVVNFHTKITLENLQKFKVVLVTGIANPTPLQLFLKENNIDFTPVEYKDHHQFSRKDEIYVAKTAQKLNAKKRIIVTTEKDYVRSSMDNKNVFCLPIEVVFLPSSKSINEEILSYVEQSTRNS